MVGETPTLLEENLAPQALRRPDVTSGKNGTRRPCSLICTHCSAMQVFEIA